MSVKLSNFSAQNTPEGVNKIGNFLLLVAVIGTAIISLPASVPGLIVPSVLLSAGNWMIGLGVLGKALTKFFGKE